MAGSYVVGYVTYDEGDGAQLDVSHAVGANDSRAVCGARIHEWRFEVPFPPQAGSGSRPPCSACIEALSAG